MIQISLPRSPQRAAMPEFDATAQGFGDLWPLLLTDAIEPAGFQPGGLQCKDAPGLRLTGLTVPQLLLAEADEVIE